MKNNRLLMILGAIALVVIIYMILQKEKYNKSSTVTVYNSDNVDHTVTWGEACCSRQHKRESGVTDLNCRIMALDNTNFGTVPANGSLTIHPQMPSCTGDPNTLSGREYMFSISTTASQEKFYDNSRLTSNIYSYRGLDQSIALMISKDNNGQLTIKGPKNKPIISK